MAKIPFRIEAGTNDGIVALAAEIYSDDTYGSVKNALDALRNEVIAAGTLGKYKTLLVETSGYARYMQFDVPETSDIYVLSTKFNSRSFWEIDGITQAIENEQLDSSPVLAFKSVPAGRYAFSHDTGGVFSIFACPSELTVSETDEGIVLLKSDNESDSFTLTETADLYASCTEETSHWGLLDSDGHQVSNAETDTIGPTNTCIYKSLPAGTYTIDHDSTQGILTLRKSGVGYDCNLGYDEMVARVAKGVTTCFFKDITVDTEMSASGSAPISTVTINDVTTYRASLLVAKTKADKYVIDATWAEGDVVPTITITRIESGLVIDEETETTEND